MFDKSIRLNFKISAKEFAIGIGLATFGGFLIYEDLTSFPFATNGVLSLVALAGFIAGLVFFVMGFYKLFYKSLFSHEAHLYMSLPISNLQIVLSKILVGSFWLLIFLAILVYSAFSTITIIVNEKSLFNFLIDSFLMEGIPAGQIGFHIIALFWTDILNVLVFSATLLFATIFANTLKAKRFKFGINFLVILSCFVINSFIFYTVNQRLGSQFLSLLIPLAILLFFIYFSKRLLEKRYNI